MFSIHIICVLEIHKFTFGFGKTMLDGVVKLLQPFPNTQSAAQPCAPDTQTRPVPDAQHSAPPQRELFAQHGLPVSTLHASGPYTCCSARRSNFG